MLKQYQQREAARDSSLLDFVRGRSCLQEGDNHLLEVRRLAIHLDWQLRFVPARDKGTQGVHRGARR